MNKFLTVLILCIAVLGLSGCKNKPCSKMKTYSDAAAVTLGAALQCSHVDVMKADFAAEMEKRGMCKPDVVVGPISMIVCPIVVPMLVSSVVGALKPEWGCTGSMAEAGLSAICTAIPF